MWDDTGTKVINTVSATDVGIVIYSELKESDYESMVLSNGKIGWVFDDQLYDINSPTL